MWSRCSFSVTSKHSIAPSCAARGDDRDLALEIDEALRGSPAGRRALARPQRHRRRCAIMRLALAVVAERRVLSTAGRPIASSAAVSCVGAVDRARTARCAIAEPGDELLLDQPVLRRSPAPSGRAAPARAPARNARGLGRHVLELVGDDVDRRRRSGRAPPCRHRRRTVRAAHHVEGAAIPVSAQ